MQQSRKSDWKFQRESPEKAKPTFEVSIRIQKHSRRIEWSKQPLGA
jgi:hypothetical protein